MGTFGLHNATTSVGYIRKGSSVVIPWAWLGVKSYLSLDDRHAQVLKYVSKKRRVIRDCLVFGW